MTETQGKWQAVTHAELRAVESRVESKIDAVADAVGNLRELVEIDRKTQQSRDRELKDSIDSLSKDLRNEIREDRLQRRMPPGTLIAGGGLLIVLAGAVGALFMAIVGPIEERVNKVDRRIEAVEAVNVGGRITENETELQTIWNDPQAGVFARLRWEGQIREQVAALQSDVDEIKASRFSERDGNRNERNIEMLRSELLNIRTREKISPE